MTIMLPCFAVRPATRPSGRAHCDRTCEGPPAHFSDAQADARLEVSTIGLESPQHLGNRHTTRVLQRERTHEFVSGLS
jgi:hypothetical protein